MKKNLENFYFWTVFLSFILIPTVLILGLWIDEIPTGKILTTCIIYFIFGAFMVHIKSEIEKDEKNGNDLT